jgi:hypothetical protein
MAINKKWFAALGVAGLIAVPAAQADDLNKSDYNYDKNNNNASDVRGSTVNDGQFDSDKQLEADKKQLKQEKKNAKERAKTEKERAKALEEAHDEID